MNLGDSKGSLLEVAYIYRVYILCGVPLPYIIPSPYKGKRGKIGDYATTVDFYLQSEQNWGNLWENWGIYGKSRGGNWGIYRKNWGIYRENLVGGG